MKSVEISPDGSGQLIPYLMLNKHELGALMAIADKNPRTQWIWMNHACETVWAIGADRVLRGSNTDRRPTGWFKVPLKHIKSAKVLQRDMVLLRQRSLDVTEMVLVRFYGTGGILDSGDVPSPISVEDKELPGKGVEKILPSIVTIPPDGDAEYRLDQVEPLLQANTGASVPKVMLVPVHMAMIAKLSPVLGKSADAGLTFVAGRGNVPCLLTGTASKAAHGTHWTYAILEKMKQ